MKASIKTPKYFVADLVECSIVAQNLSHKEAFELRDKQADTEYELRRYAVFNYKTMTPRQFLK